MSGPGALPRSFRFRHPGADQPPLELERVWRGPSYRVYRIGSESRAEP